MIIGPIIGVDPGTTTGIAVWSPRKNGIDWADELLAAEAVRVIWRLLDTYDADREPQVKVAVERYDITPQTIRTGANRDPIHVEGAVKLKLQNMNRDRFTFMQFSRADAKNFATNDRLRALGWYRRGKPHANDAIRQVLMIAAELDTVVARMIRHQGRPLVAGD